MGDSTSTSVSATINNAASKIGANSGNIAVGSVYLANVAALTHWFFQCWAEKKLVEPDEATQVLIGAAFSHIGAKISGWTSRNPEAKKAALVARILAFELDKPGTLKLISTLKSGGSLSLSDKIEVLETALDLQKKISTAINDPSVTEIKS